MLFRSPVFSPFVFSAASDDALTSTLSSYAHYIRENPETNLHDLAYTLSRHRSTLNKRIAISALSRESLCERLEARSKAEAVDNTAVVKPLDSPPRILGVFTGQGAQWARMGAELVELSPKARAILESLEESLNQLPADSRPSWSLSEQLLAPASHSKVLLAELSQPLCTAVQIILVDLLRSARSEERRVGKECPV